jgi:plasmid stability protein
MATLYVENVPDDLYEAIREQAKLDRKSIAAEVIEALTPRFPTKAELKRRKEFYKKALEMSNRKPLTPGPHPTAEEMVREDRER